MQPVKKVCIKITYNSITYHNKWSSATCYGRSKLTAHINVTYTRHITAYISRTVK